MQDKISLKVYGYMLNCPQYVRIGYNLSCELSLVTNEENTFVSINYNSLSWETFFYQDSNQTFVFLSKSTGIFNFSISMPNICLSLNRLINGKFKIIFAFNILFKEI